jgi:hypothetical protein
MFPFIPLWGTFDFSFISSLEKLQTKILPRNDARFNFLFGGSPQLFLTHRLRCPLN